MLLLVLVSAMSGLAAGALYADYPPRKGAKMSNPCVNGKPAMDGGGAVCLCEREWTGRLCERKMHCLGFDRHGDNATCVSCQEGWRGAFCDYIVCANDGEPNAIDNASCNCAKPYTGEHCTKAETSDILSYYNNKVYKMGPVGMLSIIPMALILFWCEKMAEKRQVRRVEEMLDGQNVNLDRRVISKFLKD